MRDPYVFFIDLDNTLLDNDHVKEEIKKSLMKILGDKEAIHFWQHHDKFREYKKLVDFPNIIREYCAEKHKNICEITLGRIFTSIEFAHALYPKALEVIKHLKTLGTVILFTEGDMEYQKRKIEQSGLGAIVDAVLLYEHKLDHVKDALKNYINYKVVFIDDRASSLQKIKRQYPKVYTIEVCQGHYATVDHKTHKNLNATVTSVSKLLEFNANSFIFQ